MTTEEVVVAAEELSKKYPPIGDYVAAKNASTSSTNKVDPNPILKDVYTKQKLRELKAEYDREKLRELVNRLERIEVDPHSVVERLNLQAKKELEAQARIAAELNADKRTTVEKLADMPGKMFGNEDTTNIDLLRDNPIYPRGKPQVKITNKNETNVWSMIW